MPGTSGTASISGAPGATGHPARPGATRERDAAGAAGAIAQQLGNALVTAIALLNADAGAVFVRRPGVGLVLAADIGLSADELVRLRASPVRPELALGPDEPARGDDTSEQGCVLTRSGRDRDGPDRAGGFATVCTFPVTTPSGERWGLMELYFRRSRRISNVRRGVGEAFIRQLGWALERDRRAAAVEDRERGEGTGRPEPRPEDGATVARELGRQQRAAERAVRLQTATVALARASTIAEVCDVAVRQCVSAAGARAGTCFLAANGALLPGAAAHSEAAGVALPDTPGSEEEEAFATGRIVCIAAAATDDDATAGGAPAGDEHGCLRVAIPLATNDEVQGVLVLDYGTRQPLDDGEREYLAALARVAAQALERVRLHAAARAASQAKSDFLAMMSHELRTPLNAIMGYTGLMADEVVGPLNLTQRDQLRRVQEQARHLLTLIEEILTLSRAEVGRDELRLERVDPAELLRGVGQVLAPSAARKGLALEVEVAGTLAALRTDADKVRQVLAHLLTNAIKFTATGTIIARVEEVDEDGHRMVLFTVRDTGVGIAPEHLSRIFEPFWQADQARTRRFPGTGLGLNVTRRLAELLGGEVRVTSEPGTGSEFVFRVPGRE